MENPFPSEPWRPGALTCSQARPEPVGPQKSGRLSLCQVHHLLCLLGQLSHGGTSSLMLCFCWRSPGRCLVTPFLTYITDDVWQWELSRSVLGESLCLQHGPLGTGVLNRSVPNQERRADSVKSQPTVQG